MAHINLLPWREERRQRQLKEFLIVVGISVAIGAGSVLGVDQKVRMDIAAQETRNSFIKQETTKLDAKIKEIEALQRERERLIERMEVIQSLQGNRPVIVHVFDELARTLPDGVFYTEVKQAKATLSIVGLTESTNRVSNLMRNLDASPWFKDPKLSRVENQNKKGMKQFALSVKVVNANKKPDDEEGEG